MYAVKQKLILFMIVISMFSLSLASQELVATVSGGDGSTGTIQFGVSSYVASNYYTIILEGLTAEADYTLDFTAGCATQTNFTTLAGETTRNFYVQLNTPTSGSECLVTLESQSDGVAIDYVRLQTTSISKIINQDVIIETILTLLVIGLILGMVLGLVAWKKMR